MTCCIAYKIKNKGIILVADTAGTDNCDNQLTRVDPKLFSRDDFMFAVAGSFRLRDVLMYDFDIPKKSKNVSIDKYMRTKFINALRNTCIDKGLIKKNDDTNEEELVGEFLVCYKDKIYKIESDLQVGESVDNFYIIGSGEQLAIGALAILEKRTPQVFNVENIKNTLFDILSVASKYKSSVRGPYITINNFGEENE